MSVSWRDSGKGPLALTLVETQHLAVDAGFVFDVEPTAPIAKRANLTKMFEFFGCNSLTAFRQKFSTYEMDPTTKCAAGRPVWGSHQRGSELFFGQLVGGRRHGPGVLLSSGSSESVIYIGAFEDGLHNGYGVILTPRGETFHGFFKDGVMWGPGAYTFPQPPPSERQHRHRVRFDGMHNGRPCGKGILVWSDGKRECGEFDGMQLVRGGQGEGYEGVRLVAQQNAEMAKRVAAETEEELQRHGLWDGGAKEAVARATHSEEVIDH